MVSHLHRSAAVLLSRRGDGNSKRLLGPDFLVGLDGDVVVRGQGVGGVRGELGTAMGLCQIRGQQGVCVRGREKERWGSRT